MRALLGLLALCWVAPAAALPEQTWVLAIGNNFGDPGEIGLRYAEDDARSVTEVLHAVAGVASDRIRLVTGESADAVRRSLAQVKAEIARAAPQGASALVVYYSGHADAHALHLGGSQLPLDELVDSVRAAGARTRLLLLDACRSGGATRVKGVSVAASFDLKFVEAADTEGLAVITSSTAREASLESDRLRGSFFTHYFVAGLRGAADTDGDGQVTLDEVYAFAYQSTVRASGRTESIQHPTFKVDMKGKGAVVLARLDARRSLARLELREPALYLITDANDGRMVAEVQSTRAGALVALPPRRFRVQHRRPTAYLTYDVALEPGGQVALKGLPAEETRYDRLVRKGGGARQVIHGIGVMFGLRDGVVEGEGAAPHLLVEYGLDTPWFTPALRLRGARAEVTGAGLGRTHTELGVGLTLQRYVDFRWASVSVGILGEVAHHTHDFATQPDRVAWSGSFGALIGVERILSGPVSLRLEGGPLATITPTSRIELGAEVETETRAIANVWAALGLRLRL